jgi:hypothetical protein
MLKVFASAACTVDPEDSMIVTQGIVAHRHLQHGWVQGSKFLTKPAQLHLAAVAVNNQGISPPVVNTDSEFPRSLINTLPICLVQIREP